MSEMIEKYDGRKILIDEEFHEVCGKVEGRPAIRLKSPNGKLHEISVDDFRLRIAAGQVVDREGVVERIRAPEEILERDFRAAVIERDRELRGEGRVEADRQAKLFAEFYSHPRFRRRKKKFPTMRTIQTWRAGLRKGTLRSLEDHRHLSGNRRRRHDEIFESIVFDLIEEVFLTSDLYTPKSLWRTAEAQYLDFCAKNGLKPKCHGEKVVQSLIDTLPHRDVVRRRLGGDAAHMALFQASQFMRVSKPFERIEIDSTVADIFVVIDEEGNVARPNVCMALDCATGLIVGMTVSLDAPNAVLSVRTLKEAMMPKEEVFFEKYSIVNRFQAYGRPLMTICDQGSENSGDAVEAVVEFALLELGYNRPKCPQKKPYVERLMGTLKDFVTQLDGASKTREMPNRMRISKGMGEACLTLDEFITRLQRWRYDVYSQTERRRVQAALRTKESPIAAWRRLKDDYLVPDPPTPRELEEVFYAGREQRTLHHYGVEFRQVQYFGKACEELLYHYGPGVKLDLRYDPTDIRSILVKHPNEGADKFVKLPAKEEDLPAISFAELQRIRKVLSEVDPERTQKRITTALIFHALTQGVHNENKGKRTRNRNAKRAAAAKRRENEVVDRSRTPPAVSNDLLSPPACQDVRLSRPVDLPVVEGRKK